MAGLRDLLQERKDTIVERWVHDALAAAYPGGGATAFGREQDRFANPVGHSLRVGTRAIFDAILEDADGATVRCSLDEIVRIRAVQQLSATDAIGFLFHLKALVRAELGAAADDQPLAGELAELERRIDRIVLAAFELYVAYRERVCELRINELKRSIPWMVGKVGQE
jgi:hypothetical protein